MLTTEIIESILSELPGRSIGLIGDLFLDRYLEIDPLLDEPSIETGLTAYQVTNVRSEPGALGTVLKNLVALGVGRLTPITIIGDDGEGYELKQALARLPGVSGYDIVIAGDRRTPTYTKPLYGTRELNRLDIKNRTATPDLLQDRILALLDELFDQFDALLILDQVSEENCGVITTRVRDRLAEYGLRHPDRFLLADSRERIALFRDVCTKPNENEYERSSMRTDSTNRHVFVTQSENGIRLIRPIDSTLAREMLVPAYPVSGPIDPCGAGDSCSAAIACAITAGQPHDVAAAFGNLIASITVQKLGMTGSATPDEVRERWRIIQAAASK